MKTKLMAEINKAEQKERERKAEILDKEKRVNFNPKPNLTHPSCLRVYAFSPLFLLQDSITNVRLSPEVVTMVIEDLP